MNKFTLLNYYKELNERQKEAVKEKKSAIIFHTYLDDMQNLTFEQRGVLMSALLFYARTHGAEELPKEIADKLNEDFLLCFMFQAYQQREAKATKEWCNHRGVYAKKHSYFVFEDGTKRKIKGNIDNAPNSYEDEDLYLRGKDLKGFIDFGNTDGWSVPWKELAEEWLKIYQPEDDDKLPF